ncbi:MAG: isoprenylcysteine carboxylmethyltransferase family protein [Leptolyngbya sp. SIO3F4]|nr:isoprenylcysteine carboxylmethyltransferase family protein [Leptolyngbya sp. SIO3F4]
MVSQTVSGSSKNRLGRVIAFLYGLICYAIFFVTFLYAAGFVSNFIVPRSIDSAPVVSLSNALLVNIALLGLFGLQHSGMARKEFKQKWTQLVPQAVERSTYVLFSSLCLITLFYFWQPMGGNIWQVTNPIGAIICYSIAVIGWLTVLGTTFLINHFDLFGLRQVWFYLRGKECSPLKFVTPGPYNYVRHPLYVGFLLAFWATPSMTVAHLVFALVVTIYILVAVQLEERDLVADHGEDYRNYRRHVPMLIPFRMRRSTRG